MYNSPMNAKSTAEAVKELALKAGFALVGITGVQPSSRVPEFQQWLQEGRQGVMDYLGREPAIGVRLEPSRLLPEAESIIFLGMPYATGGSQPEAASGLGLIAAYARGMDYHQVLRERCVRLVESITHDLRLTFQSRITVDTAPVLEKPLAQRAGLGWQGRNSCLISPKIGSFFFISAIFSSLALEPDLPFEDDFCGTCRRCMDVCPTGCILPNRTIDSPRCIAYLTIEHRGSIPADLRGAICNHIFGCDICQQVCPWNKKPHGMNILEDFLPAGNQYSNPDLVQLAEMDAREFDRLYRNTPIQRAKHAGLVRNVLIALGNDGDPSALQVVISILRGDPDHVLRGHAAWALGRLNVPKACNALSDALKTETNPEVIAEIKSALES